MRRVFGVTGWKNSGKTTMVSNLVTEFTKRGLRVSTVKHAHKNYRLDHDGTDSSHHRDAGAMEVALVSQHRWAIMHEVQDGEPEPPLEAILAKLSPCDLVILEGFKSSDFPKLECIRKAASVTPHVFETNRCVIACASDIRLPTFDGTQFDINDISGIANFITQHVGLEVK